MAMEIRSCLHCRKPFQSLSGRALCSACFEKDQEEYYKVRDFLRENPSASVIMMVQKTGISLDRIKDFIREGRLVIPGAPELAKKCPSCDQPITEVGAKFCAKCTNNLAGGAKRALGGSGNLSASARSRRLDERRGRG